MHDHNFDAIVRMRGAKVRRQCECKKIGPWVRVVHEPIFASMQDLMLLSKDHLTQIAGGMGIHFTTKTTKPQFAELLKGKVLGK